jgi:DNA repair protein RadC
MEPHNDTRLRPVNIVTLKMVREKRLGYNSAIACSEDVIHLIRSIFKESYREIVAVIGVDNSNRPTIVHTVALGSPNQAPVSISSVFKPLLLSNSVGFIVVHNHCASTMSPSSADRDLTEKLKTIGTLLEIAMLDHIILDADCSDYYSFKMHGAI